MPAVSRPARSLLTLASIAFLLASSAPEATLGGERGVDSTRSALAVSIDPPHPERSSPPVARDSRLVEHRSGVAAGSSRAVRTAWTGRAVTDVPEPVAKSMAAVESTRSARTSGDAYKGRNHVWIPALEIDRSVSAFACSSSAYPGDRVYRWGCAGSKNVYLFGHAHSVFKGLHDAYVRGRLAKGMRVVYADGAGRITRYAVAWWKVTTPDKGAWAYAAQAKPSLTLQTCVGAASQFRLIVRLTKVG